MEIQPEGSCGQGTCVIDLPQAVNRTPCRKIRAPASPASTAADDVGVGHGAVLAGGSFLTRWDGEDVLDGGAVFVNPDPYVARAA
ncbi:MAG: hypothetical protein H5T84_02560 [Thermoleophilia bacterium]|nr:hypothetical protein [Thermoleophilia bacterium]